ncbi:MAG: NAD(P)/FAD-dependent oxidoreductase [Anaerolineae bacterium]|nr:NAD(P)/FAD-dependent oxidoreductase [Anaerolineae bacterium]
MQRVIIVGAGAAGLIAAGRAAELGAEVHVFEKTEEAGKKILVSGQSRCNVTNSAPLETFIKYYGRQGQFLRNAYHRFFRDELLALLRRYGVETQTERGGRIFPTSGQAADVRDALLDYAVGHGALVEYKSPVSRLLVADGKIQGVELRNGIKAPSNSVILTTGGASWIRTGSTGDGYRMAQDVGHTIIALRPALVPLRVREQAHAKALQGVSLRNVCCTLLTQNEKGKEKVLHSRYPQPPTGEMLFTHFGVSGPLILTRSLDAVDALRQHKKVLLSIDLKPGMSRDEVQHRLQKEFEEQSHKQLANLLKGWVPHSLAQVLADISGVGKEREVHTIRAPEREAIAMLIKDFRWEITGALPLEAGMVTAGGVSLKEIEPQTFASRKVSGLYLAGEVLDIAADTGGFNLQAAFSGGYLAGEDAARQ